MYIRTIMGSIYKVDNNKYGVIEKNGIFKKYCENMGHSWYSELVVTKQSENLEELCDEFRYSNHERCWKNGKAWYDYDMDYYTLNKKEISTIKGAIWTDKGLIYVAKMNEQGELELI